MINETKNQIMTGARQCFFRHGYTASNITLISQYAGFSRVTVHKQFKNKDDAFRQLCLLIVDESTQACEPILENTTLPCWEAIESIMAIWLRPTFEEVSDQVVMRDLKYHVQEVADDIFVAAHELVENMIRSRLTMGIENQEINIANTEVTIADMANLLVACLDGVRGHIHHADIKVRCHQLVNIFKQATLSR